MAKFKKIQKVNDWGRWSYYTDVVRDTFGMVSERSQDQSKRIKAGDTITVRWPNKKITKCKTKGLEQINPIHDHGFSDSVLTERLVVRQKIHGMPVDIDIENLTIKVID